LYSFASELARLLDVVVKLFMGWGLGEGLPPPQENKIHLIKKSATVATTHQRGVATLENVEVQN